MAPKKTEESESFSLRLQYLFDYGVDLARRVIRLTPDRVRDEHDSAELSHHHFDFIDAALSELEGINRSAITIRIFSYGGETRAALAIIGRIKNSKCKIITEGYGAIESAASLILACGDERRISRFASFMWHETQLGALDGGLAKVKADLKQAEIEDRMWCKWMSEFSNKSEEFYATQGQYIDVYWTPEKVLEMGIVDKII